MVDQNNSDRKQADGAKELNSGANSPENRAVDANKICISRAVENIEPGSRYPLSQALHRINRAEWWMIFLTGAIAIGTLASAAIFSRQLSVMQGQLNEMRNEERALIGPTAGIMETPTPGLGLKTSIFYSNFGKSPAKYTDSSVYRTFTRGEWDDGTATKSIQNYRKACMSAEGTSTSTDVLFPTNINNAKAIKLNTGDARNSKTYIATSELISGGVIFAQMGCFVYETQNDIHHTAFCYFYDVRTTQLPALNICAVGPDSD